MKVKELIQMLLDGHINKAIETPKAILDIITA